MNRKITRATKLKCLFCASILSVFGVVLFSLHVFAATVDSVVPKVYAEGIFTCYDQGILNSNLGSLSNYQDPFQSLINLGVNSNSSVPLVTGLADADSAKCSELLFGRDYDSWNYWHDSEILSGIFQSYPVGYSSVGSGTVESPESEQRNFLLQVGYDEASENIDGGQCARFRFTKNSSIYVEANPADIPDDVLVYSSKLCAELDSGGGVQSMTVENNTTDDFIVFDVLDNSNGQVNSEYDQPNAVRMTYNRQGTLFGDDTATFFYYDGSSFEEILNYFLGQISEVDFLTQREFSLGTTWYYLVTADPVELVTTSTINQTYSIDDTQEAATTALQSANLGYTSYDELAFTPAEELALYTYYLNDVYGVTSICDPDSYSQSAMGDGWAQVQVYDAESGSVNANCYVERPSNASTTVNGLNGDKHFGTSMDFDGVVAALNAIDADEIAEDDLTDMPSVTPEGSTGDDSGGEEVEDPCYAQAGALGWIMCPVVNFLNDNMEQIYTWVEENFLQIRSDLFSNASYGVEDTWGLFRNIANTLFVIALIVIILSQLTGVGVSNYGVKKMLPRIIMAAILINLSYIICEVAIDISNILGASLKALLEGMVTVSGNAKPGGAGSGLVIGSLAAIGIVVTVILNPAVLITVLLFLLSGIIAVLFLWILLVARQAGIIIGVILSPIAIALYMLPNTQGIFKRYIKIMQGLLLLYPICGLVVGGGNFAATVMVNIGVNMSDGTAFVLAGMALQILPFFFIPALLKGSFAALGNIGARISGFGNRLGGRVNQGLRKTNTVQDMQRRGAERRMRIRAGLDKNGNVSKNKLTKLASIGPGRNRRRAAASAALDKNYATSRYGDAGFIAAQAARRQASQESSDVKAMEDLINTERLGKDGKDGKLTDNLDVLQSRYEDALRNNDSVRIKAYQNVLASKGDDGRQAIHKAVKSAEKDKYDSNNNLVARAASGEAMLTHASNLINHHGSEFKANSRDTFNHAQGILSHAGKKMEEYEQSYGGLIDSLKDETLGSMDDDAFKRLKGVEATGDDVAKQKLYDAAYDALQNSSAMAGVKQSRRNELRELASHSAKAKVVPVPSDGTSSTDSGSLNPRTQTTGDVLRTGNDDHAPAQPASAPSAPARPVNPPAQPTSQPPVPNGATVTDSGLVIAHGDMSGEQIRDFARQMDDYNRRQGNNGQNNSLNGQNNRNR